MYFIRLHLIFSLLLLSFSQGLTQAYLFDAQRFTAEDGLPDLFTAAITKDNDSFMWGATNNGLYQYDGYEFKNYPLEQRIQQIKVDEQNNLWLFSSRRKNTLFPDSQSIVNIDIFNTKTKEIIPFENYFAQSPPFLPNEVVLFFFNM